MRKIDVLILLYIFFCCCFVSTDAGIFGALFKVGKAVAKGVAKVAKKAGPILKEAGQEAAMGYLEGVGASDNDDDGRKTYNLELSKLASILLREEVTTPSQWKVLEFLRKLDMPKPPPVPPLRCITVDRNPQTFSQQLSKPIIANDGFGSGWGYYQGYVGPLLTSEVCLAGETVDLYWAVEIHDRTSADKYQLIRPDYDNGSYCIRETLLPPYNIKCENYHNDDGQYCITTVLETIEPISANLRNKRFVVEWSISLKFPTSRCTLIEPQFVHSLEEEFRLTEEDKNKMSHDVKSYVNCLSFGLLAGAMTSLSTLVLLAALRPEYKIYVQFSAKRMKKLKELKQRQLRRNKPLKVKVMQKMGVGAAFKQLTGKQDEDGKNTKS